LRELAQGTIDSFSSFSRGQPVDAAYYRQAWSTLKAAEAAIGRTLTLPVDENLARQIDGLEGMKVVRSVTRTARDFIKTAESVLGFIDIDTDSLAQTLLAPAPAPPPVEPPDAKPPHKGTEASSSMPEPALPPGVRNIVRGLQDRYPKGRWGTVKELQADFVRKSGLSFGSRNFETALAHLAETDSERWAQSHESRRPT
jgi:hypothetical protein